MPTVLKEPPYEIHESGYAGFDLPVEIHFRNKEEPRKISYTYDLFLNMQEAVYNLRREKLTFQNPSAEFMKKLLKAGGVSCLLPSSLISLIAIHSCIPLIRN